MADPKRLDAIWGRAVAAYPELGRKWGTAGHPVDSEGNTLNEPLQEYLELLKARNRQVVPQAPVSPQVPVAPQPTTATGLAVRDPDYWEAEQWKRRGGEIGEGLVSLAKTAFPFTSIPHMLDRKKWASEALEALPEDAAWWKKGLAAFTGFLEPEMGALQAAQEIMSPATGALMTVPGISEPEVRERYGYFRDQGHDPISALSAAYQQTVEEGEISLWKSIPAEFVTDPLELLPGGVIVGGVRHGLRGARAGTKAIKAIPKALPEVLPEALPVPKPEVPPVAEMQMALPMTDVLRPRSLEPSGEIGRVIPRDELIAREAGQLPLTGSAWEEAMRPSVPARELAERQAAEAADIAEEAGRREDLIARERDVLGSMWTGKTPQKTVEFEISKLGQAPSVPVATPVITDDFGRIWVGAIPRGGKEAIERMTPAKRTQYGRWANIGDEIIGSNPPLVTRPMHPVESFITDDMRNVWKAEEAAGRNNPLSTLVEYSQRGLDNIPTFKPARSRYLNMMSRQIFGSASRDNVTKIEDYINWINNPEDSIFKWEQKEFSFSELGEQLDLSMGDPNIRASLFDEFFMRDPETGGFSLKEDRPPRHTGRGTPSVVEASATTQKGHKGYPSIGDPVMPDDAARLEGNLLSRWVHDANWGVFGLKLIDEARKSIYGMATVDELMSGYFKRASQPFKAATRRLGAITRLNETFLSNFIEEGTEELQRLGWLDKNRRATSEALGTLEAPGPLRILFYALHGADDINPSSGLSWHQELTRLGVDAERQYNNLKKITKWEEAYRVQGDMISLGREDYFYRGWTYADGAWENVKQNINNAKLARPGTKAAVMMARNKLLFKEMEELGFRPTFWNPYEMASASSNMGMQYRLQLEFLRILKSKELGLAEPLKKGGDAYNNKVQEGWREVLDAGPAFKGEHFYGKPHKFNQVGFDEAGEVSFDVNATFSTEHAWLFPKEIADEIERLFAPTSNFERFMKQQRRLGFGNVRLGVDVKIDDFIFIPKRAKLFMSLFQQVDFFSRAGIGGTSAALYRVGNGMRMLGKGNVDAGFRELYASAFHVGTIPKNWYQMARANVSPAYRKTLKNMRLDDTPWHLPDDIVGNKKLIDQWKIDNPELAQYSWINAFANGLSIGDVTIFGTADDAVKLLDDIIKESGAVRTGIVRSADFVRRLESAFRAGLFDGVYPAAIMHDLRYNIVPILKQIHPDLNADQLMGLAAKQANKKWSTIPIEQSSFQGFNRSVMTRVMFSLNEFESMAKQITGAFRGPDKMFWAAHWAGAFVFFAFVGNLIHFVTTSLTKRDEDGKWTIDPSIGELIPKDRYIPYNTGGYYTLGYKFNDKFLSPDIPVPTRSGDLALLDLLNQFDFIFRMTDGERGIPIFKFFNQRMGTMPRAIWNQVRGTDWMGRDITEYGLSQRTLQFLYDTVAPIGAGQLAVATTRNALKDKELPHLQNRIINIVGKGANIERITPSVESRLGQDGHGILGPIDLGILLQATGLNLKSLGNDDLRDQMVMTTFGKGDHPDHEGLVLRSWKELQAHKDSRILGSIPFRDIRNSRQIKELEERKAEGAEFFYDDFGKMSYEIGKSVKQRREAEAKIAEKFYGTVNPGEKGNPNPGYQGKEAWSPSSFRAALKAANRDHRIRKEAIETVYSTDPNVLKIMAEQNVEPSRSTESLEWAIYKFGKLREVYRDPISGDIDYKMKREGLTLDEAWEAETSGWDDEEEAETGGLLDRFNMWLDQGDHHPLVDEYYDALKVLDNAGYWQDGPKVQGDEFHRQLNALAGHQGLSYEEGLNIWDIYLSASVEERRRLRAHPSNWAVQYIIKNMDVVRKAHRFKTVMRNPALDKLLIKWFGNTPYLQENGRYYYELYGKLPSSYRKNPYL